MLFSVKAFKKTTLVLAVLLLTLQVNLNKAYANEIFDTEYKVTYDINATGAAQITQDILIENKQNSTFATNYSLTISQMHIYDIAGTDKKGPLEIEVKDKEAATDINAQFNEQIIGEGRQYNWQLAYKSNDIASQVGEVWNVHIPRIASLEDIRSYTITLNVPHEFGPEVFVSPQPVEKIERSDITTYVFDKILLENKGVTASFGNYQLLNYKLDYHLKNTSSFSSQQQIALPPDILEKQQVYIKELKPTPVKLETDRDGNTIATYKLKPKQDLNVSLIGSVRISSKQIYPEFGGIFNDIPADLNIYTKPDTFWETNANEIQHLAGILKNKDKTVAQNAQEIYNYITQNLEYDFDITKKDFVERKGALNALTDENQAWACMEFTDLFIAISRSMGIPARELNGFAYTTETSNTPLSINLKSGDLLHAWPEFYDPNFGWVAIDPTWGTTSGIDYFTKLDTNHFVFVTKGVSSEHPFPAGTYKVTDTEKQVEVDFAQTIDEGAFKPQITLYETKNLLQLFAKIQNKKQYIAHNNSGVTIYNLNGTGENLLPLESKNIYLPNATQEIAIFDFNNVEKRIKPVLTNERPPTLGTSTFIDYFIWFLIALVLCGIVFVSLTHAKDLKSLFLPRLRRLQGRGQQRGRRSK